MYIFHFRFDSNVDMKVAGLVSHMSKDNSIKKFTYLTKIMFMVRHLEIQLQDD